MKQKHIFFLLAALISGAAFFFYTQPEKASTREPISASAPEESARSASQEPLREYRIPVSGSTVLSSMEAFAASGEFSFSGREYPGLGLFVEEIGGLKNAEGFYWTLFVNGILSEKGASSAEIAPDSNIEWRYQKGL